VPAQPKRKPWVEAERRSGLADQMDGEPESRSTISISSKVVNSGRAASTVEIASGIVATSRDRSAMSRAWTWARSWRRGYHRLVETLGLEAADGQAQTPRSSWL